MCLMWWIQIGFFYIRILFRPGLLKLFVQVLNQTLLYLGHSKVIRMNSGTLRERERKRSGVWERDEVMARTV